ncbi:MAG: YXWGXW repeat-containing protein [Sphingobacteriales bacterium]|nr:YXWGXW repeat-containing protein [Sphingobacteriales bacterium]
MKKMYKFLTAIIIVLSLCFTASAQRIFVKVRPVAPVIVRPVAPSPRHVWVEGEWVPRNRRYEYSNGYWAEPSPGKIWVEGHWKQGKHGNWRWIPGHWVMG